MKRRLLKHAVVLGTVTAMVAGVTAISTVQAEGNHKGTRGATAPTNEATTQDYRVQQDSVNPVFGDLSNDNIAPAAGPVTSTSPRSSNTYETTTSSKPRDDVRRGR